MIEKLPNFDVIVVGAGLAGLSCAHKLQDRGLRVLVLDKSRGLGGRVATRRIAGIPLDHGLPALTIQGEQSQALLASLGEQVEPWQGDRYLVKSDYTWELFSEPAWYCPRGMTGVGKYLAQGLEIQREYRVTSLTREADYWLVEGEGKEALSATKVVLAIPAPQILPLLPPDHPLTPALSSVEFDPCITLMVAYQSVESERPWSQLLLNQHPHLRMVILNSTKHQSEALQTMVLHSSASFAQSYLDDADYILRGESLVEQLPSLGITPVGIPQWSQVHRWRYAFPRVSPLVPYLASVDPLALVCCGDWCLGTLVEGALSSGKQAADFLLI